MALLTWSGDFSVKVNDFDNQHIKLVSLINELHAAMKDGKGKEILGKIITELVSYTKYHFTYEEKLMIQHKFPGYLKHKVEHDEFTKKVSGFENDYKHGKAVISQEVLIFLKDWIVNHIKVTDKNYSEFFNSAGVN